MLLSNPLPAHSPMMASRTIGPIHSAALLQGPAGVALHLHGVDGAMTQVPLTLAALREIAALAGAATAAMSPEPLLRPGA